MCYLSVVVFRRMQRTCGRHAVSRRNRTTCPSLRRSVVLTTVCLLAGPLPIPATGTVTRAAGGATVVRCYTNQLSISPDSGNSGAGHVGVYFRLHNHSQRACTLFGYPGAQLLDGRGHALHTVLHWGIGSTIRRLVLLRPGSNAYFLLEWAHVPMPGQTCPRAPAILITPPNAYTSIRVSMVPGGIDACGGIINAGPVEPSRIP